MKEDDELAEDGLLGGGLRTSDEGTDDLKAGYIETQGMVIDNRQG